MLQHKPSQSVSKQEHHTTQFTTKIRTRDRHINSFLLLYNEPECYVYNNFGHKASELHLMNCKIDLRMSHPAGSAKFSKKKENNSVV